MRIIQAKRLRNSDELKKVPGNCPGWYRWWTQKSEVSILLDSCFLSHAYFNELFPLLHNGVGELRDYYYIYTGIAVKESIRARLNWHVNQRHTDNEVRSGTLSTLRQTIASLLAGSQKNESATNDFIDKLVIEYEPAGFPVYSIEAKKFLEDNEGQEMRNNLLILNIKDNHRAELNSFLKDLKHARKYGKGS